MDEPTDLDQITGHPFQPMRGGWEDTCGHLDSNGWTCGYAKDEHVTRLEGAAEEVTPSD